jgi:hypothetical protein
MACGEPGAVYRLPSGAFAFLNSVGTDAVWQLEVVDLHRCLVIENSAMEISDRMADRLKLAWHAGQWAVKVRERMAMNARVAEQAREDEKARQARSESWARAQQKIMEGQAHGHTND